MLIVQYCIILNSILKNSYFPNTWKLAKVVLIPKKDKDRSNSKNLRLISIIEICINKQILNCCEKLILQNPNLFGFKYKHSTVHTIHLLISKKSCGIFVEFSIVHKIGYNNASEVKYAPFCSMASSQRDANFIMLLL